MRLVAGFFALFFLLAGILPESDFCELRKLPALFAHYLEHREAGGDTFAQFLYEDFLSNQGDEQNHHGRKPSQDLPFQHHATQTHCCNYTLVSMDQLLPVNQEGVTVHRRMPYTYQYSFLYLDSIFEPPQA